MVHKPTIIAMDLEGVLIPEIWISFAEKTGIKELRLTTRDEQDYNKLMEGRLRIINENNFTLTDIQKVIETLDPFPGAVGFVSWTKSHGQLIILSDTYYEFAEPLMKKLGNPTLFCNSLAINDNNRINNYRIRKPDGKKHAVKAFKDIGFRVIAIGDSYNDTTMLKEADIGILFKAPKNISSQYPEFPLFHEFEDLKNYLEDEIT